MGPRSNLLIQILDDSDDPITRILVLIGNLKSAMNCSYIKDYEFVAIFDADFWHLSDFLKRKKGSLFQGIFDTSVQFTDFVKWGVPNSYHVH